MSLGLPSPSAEAEARLVSARRHCEAQLGDAFGCPVFIRIIKEERLLELWIQRQGSWALLKSYPIAGMSGTLGPKCREGDRQAPEGFYDVLPERMKPESKYHLAFNIGYPNAYDRSLGRTGSFIMVHGSDSSAGCFAMTDAGIEEIYTLVHEAFLAGQKRVEVHIYPFAMTAARMEQEQNSPHIDFWRSLLPRWQLMQEHHAPALDPDFQP